MTSRVLTIKHANGSTSPFQADTDAEVVLILQKLLKMHVPAMEVELTGEHTASRKRLYTKNTLNVIDTSGANADKLLGILHMLEKQLNVYLEGQANEQKDTKGVISVAKDLVFEIKQSCDNLQNEELVYADTLEEYLAERKSEITETLSS